MEEEQATPEIDSEQAAEIEESAPSETEEQTEETAEDSGAEQPKKSKGVQKRIDELVRQREEERRAREIAEARLHEVYTKQQKQPEPKQEPTKPKPARPTLEQYGYDENQYNEALSQYEEAVVDWKLEQRDEVRRKEEEQQKQRERQTRISQGIEGLKQKGAEKHPDFADVAFVPVGFEDVFVESETGAELAYYLGKHPEEVKALNGKDRGHILYRLGQIDARLSIVPPKATTKAPEPIKPVGARDATHIDSPSLATKNPEEWIRQRNEGKF